MFFQVSNIVVLGILLFCFGRKISYRVLNHGISKPAPEQETDIRDFLYEMILFGLGIYFCVGAMGTFLYAAIGFAPSLWSEFGMEFDFNAVSMLASFGQIIIAVVLILGRRPILRFVQSFRTKEYGKRR